MVARGQDAPVFVVSTEGVTYRDSVIYRASADPTPTRVPGLRTVTFERVVWVWPGFQAKLGVTGQPCMVVKSMCFLTFEAAVAYLHGTWARETQEARRELEVIDGKIKALVEAKAAFASHIVPCPDWRML